jgi:hypothetical protein
MTDIEKWDKAKASLQSAIINSLGPANVAIINANTPAGIASLSCKDLVQWVETKSSITTDEIEIVEETLLLISQHRVSLVTLITYVDKSTPRKLR